MIKHGFDKKLVLNGRNIKQAETAVKKIKRRKTGTYVCLPMVYIFPIGKEGQVFYRDVP